MRHGRRYFTKHPRPVVLPAGNLDLPRRRGLLLWLSGLAALLYVVQVQTVDGKAAPRQGLDSLTGHSAIGPNG